ADLSEPVEDALDHVPVEAFLAQALPKLCARSFPHRQEAKGFFMRQRALLIDRQRRRGRFPDPVACFPALHRYSVSAGSACSIGSFGTRPSESLIRFSMSSATSGLSKRI